MRPVDGAVPAPRIHPVVVSALSFALVLLIAGPPWPLVRRSFASVYSAFGNGVIGQMTFGKGGHVHFTAGDTARDGRRPQGEVTVDTIVEVSVTGYKGTIVHGLSSRRDAYLPLVILVAAIAAVPLGLRARIRCLLIGVVIETAIILLTTWLFIVWDLALGLGLRGVYDLSPLQRGALDLAFRALLLPPGNRFVFPLLIVAGLVWLSLGPSSGRLARRHPGTAASANEKDQAGQREDGPAPQGQ